jgi:recombination protein RecT
MSNPIVAYVSGREKQIAQALPSHMDSKRHIRIALTSISQSPTLQECSPESIYRSILLSAQTGLEIGVGGQAYLVPYKGAATFVPGWQGLVDLVSRAGRATVWTGAVYEGDFFDWTLGDTPMCKHKPAGASDVLSHVYAIGRVRDAQYPIIEVWSAERIKSHRDKNNKVGNRHYSFQNFEMYARKIALLQVLKYLPKSIELQTAITADHVAAEPQLQSRLSEGDYTVDTDSSMGEPKGKTLDVLSDEEFQKQLIQWSSLIENKDKTASEILAIAATKFALSDSQTAAIKAVEKQSQNEGNSK